MEKLRKGLARYAGDLVLVAGAAAITVGAGILNSLGGGDEP